MNILYRLVNRIRHRRLTKSNESKNVVAGMVKARKLYKDLVIKAHPDKHPDKCVVAEDITSRLTRCKYDYAELLKLRDEIQKKL